MSLNNNILTAMTSYTLDVFDLDQLHDATSVVGAFYQAGPDTGFDTAGDTLFLGRRILDVSDPAAPTVVGTLPMIGDRIDSILARGDRVYAAQDVFPIARTTAIVDVADPAQARLLGTLPFSSILSQMMDANERTVVDAPERNMFRVWDITDPARPILASTTTIEPVDNAWIGPMGPSVRLIDNRLYIASDNLFTYDVSDATRPVLVSTLMTPGFSRLMAVDGNRIFSVADYHWFQVIDISDPTAPEIIGNLQLPGTVHDLLVANGYVVVATGTGLLAVDVSDPTQPILADAPSAGHLQGLTRLALASSGIVAGDYMSGKVNIYHLGNAPGISVLTASPTAGIAPLTVRFSATTADADGTVNEFRWDFDGDGVIDEITSTGEISHTYTTPGMYHPLLQVADDQSLVTTAPSLSVRVDDPAQAYTVYISGLSPEFPSCWLVNPGEDPAEYTLNGFTDTIPAGGKVALSSATTGGTITSTRRILLADEWTSPGRNMAAWFSSPASSRLVAPHVAVDLADWDTLAFLNPVADNGFILSMADRSLSWNDYYPSFDLGTMAEGLDDSVAWALFKTRPRNPFTDPGKTSGIETFTLRNGDGAAVELVGTGSEKLFIPHLPAPGSGYWAGIGLVNLEERTIRVTFSFYSADGSPQGTDVTVSIPPRTKLSSLIRELIPDLPDGAVWGYIEADGRLAGAEVFGSETAGLAGLSLADDALTTGILPLVHTDSDRLTGVAFTNPSGVEARIVVSLVSADGTVKGQQEIIVGPMSQVARLAGQLFAGLTPDETDTIRFSANNGVIATEVLVDPVSFTMCALSAAM